MEQLKIGDRVQFIGCSEDQINWGSNDDPNKVCELGYVYHIEYVTIHSQHTKIQLKGIQGKFNSVCFERVN